VPIGSVASMREPRPPGFAGAMSRVYDVFVDWPGRLAREMPGIERHLRAVGAKRVIDLGCGTGRHVQALLERGYDAHGADVSEDMLAQARTLLGESERVHAWRLGDPPPPSVARAAPFDAAIAMGNVWPILASESEARGTADAVKELVRPGGLLLLGFKAFEVRKRSGLPYLPLLRREHEGRVVWFVRFVDFDVPQPRDGSRSCDLHMSVLAGDASTLDERGEAEALLHRASRVRSWDPDEVTEWLRTRGFVDVRISGKLDDPDAPVTSEDVFVSARVAPAE
jgi:SAM-dependent methyltransferase